MPAAAVIPAKRRFNRIIAFKTLVVGVVLECVLRGFILNVYIQHGLFIYINNLTLSNGTRLKWVLSMP